MGEEGVDPELQALTDRIAAVRSAIAELKDERARIERTQEPADDAAETELAALRETVTQARARLADLKGRTTKPGAPAAKREAAARRTLYVIGGAVSLPSLVTLPAMLHAQWRHPEDAVDPMLYLVVSIPLLIGLGLVARGRFANYRADRDDLDGDFLA
jgi:hypothetical protein